MNQYPGPYPSAQPNPYQAPNPMAQAPYSPPGYASFGGYEFGEAENETIRAAANWTLALGIVQFVAAACDFIGGSPFGGMVDIAIGVGLCYASSSFRKVVTSQGSDVPHLMSALGTFSGVLLARIILFVIAVVIIGVAALAILALRASMGR